MNNGFMNGNDLYRIFKDWFDPKMNIKSFSIGASGPQEVVILNVEYFINEENNLDKTKLQQYEIKK